MQNEWTEEMWEVFELWEKFTASFTRTEMVPRSSVFLNLAFLFLSLHTVSELLFHIILRAKC